MGRWRDATIWAVTCTFAAVFGVAIGLGYVGVSRQQGVVSARSALPGPVEPRTSAAAPSPAPSTVSAATSPARAGESKVAVRSTRPAAAGRKPVAVKHRHSEGEHADAKESDGKPSKPKKAKK